VTHNVMYLAFSIAIVRRAAITASVVGPVIAVINHRERTFSGLMTQGDWVRVGMLIKNAIVLVEKIDVQIDEGLAQTKAIEVASVSRLRPVTLAATTAILGMVPLLWDSLFAAMALTIVAGLGFASILTLMVVPALYEIYVKIESSSRCG